LLPVTCAKGVGLGRKGKERKGREGKGRERKGKERKGILAERRARTVGMFREAALRRAVRRLNHELDSD